MFSRVHNVFFFALLAAAMPIGNAQSCDTGPIQCCNSVVKASDSAAAAAFKALNIPAPDPNTMVGLACTPTTVIGVGGGGCSAYAVCCKDDSHSGIVAIDCKPVTL
ncbi:hypothetical protein V5O48_006512 [Marasmius crinis-equi]|uniref:Hydrophobin n=1 Tax=Marasmius crinis-equi TaxID=585013 RepID=A0ABR3FK71_9AGAR